MRSAAMMTFACELTPRGRGAVATIGVRGPEAMSHVDRLFRAASGRALASMPLQRIVFGRWQADEQHVGEELVVCRTAEDEIEIHCHGGAAAVSAILSSLAARGVEWSEWKSWNSWRGEDFIQHDALLALPLARTERT